MSQPTAILESVVSALESAREGIELFEKEAGLDPETSPTADAYEDLDVLIGNMKQVVAQWKKEQAQG